MLANGLEGVAGVDVDEESVVGDGDGGGCGVLHGERVRFGAGEAVNVRARGFEPPKDVVKGAVLHHYHHHGFDRTGEFVLLSDADGDEEEEKEKRHGYPPETHLR